LSQGLNKNQTHNRPIICIKWHFNIFRSFSRISNNFRRPRQMPGQCHRHINKSASSTTTANSWTQNS